MGMREGSGFVCPVILRHRATQNSGRQRQLATRTVTLILFTAAVFGQIVPDRLHMKLAGEPAGRPALPPDAGRCVKSRTIFAIELQTTAERSHERT